MTISTTACLVIKSILIDKKSKYCIQSNTFKCSTSNPWYFFIFLGKTLSGDVKSFNSYNLQLNMNLVYTLLNCKKIKIDTSKFSFIFDKNDYSAIFNVHRYLHINCFVTTVMKSQNIFQHFFQQNKKSILFMLWTIFKIQYVNENKN